MKKFVYVAIILAFVSGFWIAVTLLTRAIQLNKYDHSLRIVASKISSQLSDEQLVQQAFIFFVKLDNSDDISSLLPGALFLNKLNLPKEKNGSDDLFKLHEQMEVIHNIYMEKNVPPPIFTIDQEWGYIRRLQKDFTDFPSAMALGEAVEETDHYHLAMLQGFYTCLELRKNGIQWPFIPVADVQTNPNNPVIGVRSFGSKPEVVTKITQEFILGMQTARCMGTMKHFPGHGDTSLDSHRNLPVVNRELTELEKSELYPYKTILTSDDPPYSIMSAHIVFSKLSPEPATLSKFWLEEKLKTEWAYKGLVITDDLEMNAVIIYGSQNGISDIPLEAFLSGVDMLLLLTNREKSERAVKNLLSYISKHPDAKSRLIRAVEKVLFYKLKMGTLDRYLVDTKIEWNKDERKAINMILAYSLEQEENIRSIEGQLATAESVNNFLSEHAIKTLVNPSGKKGFSYENILYTDLPKTDPAFLLLSENKVKTFPMSKIQNADCANACVILHVGKYSLRNVLRMKGSQPVVIFSVADPFPARKYLPLFGPNDIFITSFSNTDTSVKALVNSYLKRKLPPKAAVIYNYN
ncbi:MAG: glycoside hydrolase family 3 N-terminal domain-containing protein [Leptospirales bacterium]